MSIRINHWLIIENPFVLTLDSSFRTGSSSALPLPGGRLQFQPQPCAGIAQEHLLFGAVLELFAVEIALVEGQGSPPPQNSIISRQFMAPLSGHLPPAELCRWTWPSISFGQEKKKSIIERD